MKKKSTVKKKSTTKKRATLKKKPGTISRPIKILLKPGATEDDLVKKIGRHHKTIAGLTDRGQQAHVTFGPGKQIPGSFGTIKQIPPNDGL